MVDVIQKSAANFFTLAKRGGYTFPERATIVIADFDTDFLNTLLLVLETGEMFNVTLHAPGDPFGDSFLERGEYQIADVSQRGYEEYFAPLKKKMIAAGIKREIWVGK